MLTVGIAVYTDAVAVVVDVAIRVDNRSVDVSICARRAKPPDNRRSVGIVDITAITFWTAIIIMSTAIFSYKIRLTTIKKTVIITIRRAI